MKKVGKFSLEGDLIEAYNSVKDAAEKNGTDASNICKYCNKKKERKTDYTFQYLS